MALKRWLPLQIILHINNSEMENMGPMKTPCFRQDWIRAGGMEEGFRRRCVSHHILKLSILLGIVDSSLLIGRIVGCSAGDGLN